jgi:hypothetical protein
MFSSIIVHHKPKHIGNSIVNRSLIQSSSVWLFIIVNLYMVMFEWLQMHIIVMWCELLHLLAEKNVDSLAVEQGFKKCMSVCYISLWFYGLRQKMSPIMLVVLTAHHTPTSTWCNGISWIYNGSLLFWQFIYPQRGKQLSPLNKMSVECVPSVYSHESSSLQNSIILSSSAYSFTISSV